MSTELKPCPFCGGEADAMIDYDQEGNTIDGGVEVSMTLKTVLICR